MDFALSVASLGQAEGSALEYALLVRRRCDHTNQYIHVYSGQHNDLPNFVLDFLENRNRSTAASMQCQQGDNGTPFDVDLIKVEEVAVPARSTASETVSLQPVKMELAIEQTAGRGQPVSSRADDQAIQQPHTVPIDTRNTASKNKKICLKGTTTHDYNAEASFVREKKSPSTVHCVKKPAQATHNNQTISPVKTIGGVHACKVCGLCCGNVPMLKQHMKSKHTVSTHQCDICNKCFAHVTTLKIHIQSVHRQGSKPFKCPKCDKTFGPKSNLNCHIISIHEGQKFECQECGKAFKHNQSLQRHALIHSGEKPHVCEMCGKGFAQAGNLAIHRHRHLQIKPHQCPVCHMTFVATNDMNKHVRRNHPMHTQ